MLLVAAVVAAPVIAVLLDAAVGGRTAFPAGLDTMVQATLPDGASYRLVFAFLLVILVLVFKPSGLLGRVVIEKV